MSKDEIPKTFFIVDNSIFTRTDVELIMVIPENDVTLIAYSGL